MAALLMQMCGPTARLGQYAWPRATPQERTSVANLDNRLMETAVLSPMLIAPLVQGAKEVSSGKETKAFVHTPRVFLMSNRHQTWLCEPSANIDFSGGCCGLFFVL